MEGGSFFDTVLRNVGIDRRPWYPLEKQADKFRIPIDLNHIAVLANRRAAFCRKHTYLKPPKFCAFDVLDPRFALTLRLAQFSTGSIIPEMTLKTSLSPEDLQTLLASPHGPRHTGIYILQDDPTVRMGDGTMRDWRRAPHLTYLTSIEAHTAFKDIRAVLPLTPLSREMSPAYVLVEPEPMADQQQTGGEAFVIIPDFTLGL